MEIKPYQFIINLFVFVSNNLQTKFQKILMIVYAIKNLTGICKDW